MYDFVRWASTSDKGRQLLTCHLNRLLAGDEVPVDYMNSYLVLIPKQLVVGSSDQFRPMSLLETVQKVYAAALSARLKGRFPVPRHQLGGVPGGQVFECLLMASSALQREVASNMPGAWVSLDISGAYDNLLLSTVLEYLSRQSLKHGGALESARLAELLLGPVHSCSFQSFSFQVQQHRGVQQGGTHSPFVFSYVLGDILDRIFAEWAADGHVPFHPLWGWAYVDDILLGFPSWQHAIDLMPRFAESLRMIGLEVNPAKTVVMSTQAMLDLGVHAVPSEHVLRGFAWATKMNYLRKALQHPLEEDVSAQLVSSIRRTMQQTGEELAGISRLFSWTSVRSALNFHMQHVFSRFAWVTPAIEPLAMHINAIQVMQVSHLVGLLKLYIPNSLKQQDAVVLNRVRRRAVLQLMWMNQVGWAQMMVLRKWAFLGHLLRRPQSPAAEMFMTGHGRQSQGGPWNTYWKWCSNCTQWMYADGHISTPVDPADAQSLCDAASDREGRQYARHVVQPYSDANVGGPQCLEQWPSSLPHSSSVDASCAGLFFRWSIHLLHAGCWGGVGMWHCSLASTELRRIMPCCAKSILLSF